MNGCLKSDRADPRCSNKFEVLLFAEVSTFLNDALVLNKHVI